MGFEQFVDQWEAVVPGDAGSLGDARLSAHWAAQIIGGVGEALVAHEPDFSHTSMTWDDGLRALVGQRTAKGTRVALRLADLAIQVQSSRGVVTSIALSGKTLDEALDRVNAALEEAEGGALSTKPAIPTYEMPSHPVGEGQPFADPDTKRLKELARWYANASRLAKIVSENTLGASPVRCWPHHFDIATLVTLDPPGTDPETARSIGFGLSPGDASYDEPYFYINPWPFPEKRDGHGDLAGGAHWHAEGWFGGVLPASAIRGDRREQAEQVLAYAKSAMAADRVILGTL